ncbi:hypothetical protein NL108_010883, partial [Boleophthalmus pectinirostris]
LFSWHPFLMTLA